MMKSTQLRYGLILAGLLASSCVFAQAQFVWIDEHGVKQFSDTPPPANIPENHILKQPHRTTAPARDTGGSADAPAEAPKTPSIADQNADFNKRKAEQAEKDKKAADEAKRKETNEANCTRAKQYLASLNSGVRMQTTDKDGQRAYMNDDDRAREVQQAQKAIDESCNKN